MTQPWPIQLLADTAGQTPEQLAWYADAGLLHLDSPDVFAADSLHRLRLIRHAHRRGISNEDLALAIKEQGDLLGVFEELGAGTITDTTMAEAAHDAGLSERLVTELLDLLALEPDERANTEDLQALQLLMQALAFGIPEAALIQLIRSSPTPRDGSLTPRSGSSTTTSTSSSACRA